jgi:hypothetical protein
VLPLEKMGHRAIFDVFVGANYLTAQPFQLRKPNENGSHLMLKGW